MSCCAGSEQFWQGKKMRVEIPFSRAGVGQLVVVANDRSTILIDTGDGALRDLLQLGHVPHRIEALFYTHGHYDHMGGLHSLLGFMRMAGRRDAVRVFCPSGCVEVIRALDGFRQCYPDSIGFEIELNELSDEEVVTVSGMSVRSFGMVHCGSIVGAEVLDPIPALGYRIECDGEVVAVTGDCGRKSPLERLLAGADLAIIEGTYQSGAEKSVEVLDNVHLSEDIARELGGLATDYIIVHPGRRSGDGLKSD